MGRPINKRFIGNTSQSGQQIQATAWIPGSPGPALAYINKQTSSNSYRMTTANGQYTGIVYLTQGNVALTAGTANITVTPFGSSGNSAVATARMAASTAEVVVSGSGAITADYDIGNVITVVGGTNSAPASFTVTGIRVGNLAINAAGTNYKVGNQITFGGDGWISNSVISVTSVGSIGNITSFAEIPGGGIRSGAGIQTISGATLQGSNANVIVDGSGATFNVRWGVSNVFVASKGVFSALPSNPVSTTTSGSGTGATLNVLWNVSNVVVSNGGVGYQFPAVSFSTGGAQATATTNVAGSITGITVVNPGTDISSVPTVTIAPVNNVQWAAEIRNRTVVTFNNQVFDWVMSDITPTASNQARIQSA